MPGRLLKASQEGKIALADHVSMSKEKKILANIAKPNLQDKSGSLSAEVESHRLC